MSGPWGDAVGFRLVPLGKVVEIQLGKMLQPSLSGPQDELVPYLRAGALSGRLDSAELPEMYASPSDLKRYNVEAGDLVVAEGGDCGRSAFVPDLGFRAIIQNSLHRIRGCVADQRFVKYCLEAIHESDWLEVLCNKSTFGHLTGEKLASLRVPFPELSAQRTIADYLDRETARIDALIAAKRRMVELLEERRISAAYAAITGEQVRGLRQPSGSSWLGTVPRHWRMVRIGSMFEVRLGRMLNAERSQGPDLRPYLRNINIRWDSVSTAELAEMDFPPLDRTRYRVQVGDLLVNEGGAGIGRAAIWDGGIDEVYYQKSVHRVRSRGYLSVHWLLEWLRVAVDRRVFEIEGNLATIPHVPAEALRQFRVPCPPKREAESCLDEMETKVDRDKAMQRATERQSNLLQERRQALITATVTGQLDIPEAA